jgi:hypothetical protein
MRQATARAMGRGYGEACGPTACGPTGEIKPLKSMHKIPDKILLDKQGKISYIASMMIFVLLSAILAILLAQSTFSRAAGTGIERQRTERDGRADAGTNRFRRHLQHLEIGRFVTRKRVKLFAALQNEPVQMATHLLARLRKEYLRPRRHRDQKILIPLRAEMLRQTCVLRGIGGARALTVCINIDTRNWP